MGWLEQVSLRPTADVRHSPLLDKDNKLRTAPIYKLLVAGSDFTCPYADFVWKNCTPPRAQFFFWLLVQERIKCRTTLQTKHVVQSATCELCDATEETADHLIFHCPTAAAFWSALGFTITSCTSVRALWELSRPSSVPPRHYNTFLHLCCWMVWKHRNEFIFQSIPLSLPRLLLQCREEAYMWRCRLPRADTDVSNTWCSLFSSNM
ncbi:hypothetical protein EJB05_07633, partial [Eragrostis curvula]